MIALLDTSVLLRLADEDSPRRTPLVAATEKYVDLGYDLVLAPQVAYESWTVLTRPKEMNGFGLGPSVAGAKLRGWLQSYACPSDPSGLLQHWLRLCEVHNVRGRQGHDCRLVAWMELHGIKHLLTLNSPDFTRYAQVEVLDLGL